MHALPTSMWHAPGKSAGGGFVLLPFLHECLCEILSSLRRISSGLNTSVHNVPKVVNRIDVDWSNWLFCDPCSTPIQIMDYLSLTRDNSCNLTCVRISLIKINSEHIVPAYNLTTGPSIASRYFTAFNGPFGRYGDLFDRLYHEHRCHDW